MKPLVLRQLLADSTSLRRYLHGELPGDKSILQGLFLAERNVDTSLPDYVSRNRLEMYFEGVKGLPGILLTAFKHLSGSYLDILGNKVFIKSDNLSDWQHLLAWMPPLPLITFMLHSEWPLTNVNPAEYLCDYINCTIMPNCGRSALPRPYFPKLETVIGGKDGLSDLHIHLNGATEADHVWLHSLENPFRFFVEQRKASRDEIALEHFQQIEFGLNHKIVYDRLRLAALLRFFMVEHLFANKSLPRNKIIRVINLYEFPFSQNEHSISWTHPLRKLFGGALHSFNSLSLESLFYVAAFRKLEVIRVEDDHLFAHVLHLYLLLLGFFSKLTVQQTTQNGFDQFQKITVNEARSASEQNYSRRFEQLNGNKGDSPGFVEGRFSPQKTVSENRRLLSNILRGFAAFKGNNNFDIEANKLCTDGLGLKLRLVAHFIKKPDDSKSLGIKVRHHKLRLDLERRGQALLAAMRSNQNISNYLTGIDAAANEMHAGPEVFAPLYRLFRRRGFTNFTFHVGEDFVHLLSGIRAIHEAIHFLDLQGGNRIGHATAVGINPKLWQSRCGSRVVMSRQQWLDDLIFAYDILSKHNVIIPVGLTDAIKVHAFEIYRQHVSIDVLIKAWRMRKLDPLIACYNGSWEKEDKLIFKDQIEWDMVDDACKENSFAFSLFRNYHSDKFAYRGSQRIEVDDIFNSKILITLQQLQLKELSEKQIVIESMPTSNVRISFYSDHSEHHIKRWLGFTNKSESKPIVCLGSDDPGIFATNIVNEYAHVYRLIEKQPGNATKTLEKLVKSANDYRFEHSSVPQND